MKKFLLSVLFIGYIMFASAQSVKGKVYKPTIVSCDCRFKVDSSYIASAPKALQADSLFPNKIDSSFSTQCGYLIVPENRKKASSRMIRLPFIIVKSKNPNKKNDPVLNTAGGPGGSSLGWAQGITKSSLINDRDCITFEQRGTRYAIPYLRSFDLDTAMRIAYRKNLSKDSMTIVGLKRYKKKLLAKGIDLSGYNSDETVSDIHDLLQVLHIDSVNLSGGSYSGGLMLAVLQKDPSKVRSLVLDSPLPAFTPIDEDEPVNLNEALHVLFEHVKKDSTDQVRYYDLENRFHAYFTSISRKTFYFPYLEKGTTDSLYIQYSQVELIDAIEGAMLDVSRIKDVPFIITDMMNGNYAPYIKQKLDVVFNRNPAPDGMRISVYCADQSAYHNEAIIQQLYGLYPYMKGYHINDVYKAMCDCWNVPPLNPVTKQAFYSSKPVLIGDGDMDPACRPLYMSEIHHYMPNAQCFLFINKGHGVGGKKFYDITQAFVDHPYQKIEPPEKDVIIYP